MCLQAVWDIIKQNPYVRCGGEVFTVVRDIYKMSQSHPTSTAISEVIKHTAHAIIHCLHAAGLAQAGYVIMKRSGDVVGWGFVFSWFR